MEDAAIDIPGTDSGIGLGQSLDTEREHVGIAMAGHAFAGDMRCNRTSEAGEGALAQDRTTELIEIESGGIAHEALVHEDDWETHYMGSQGLEVNAESPLTQALAFARMGIAVMPLEWTREYGFRGREVSSWKPVSGVEGSTDPGQFAGWFGEHEDWEVGLC